MPTPAYTTRFIAVCAVFAALYVAHPARALQLITAGEAALPAAQMLGQSRGISRGPTLVIVSPPPSAGTIKSPVNLQVRFQSHGASQIDPDSVLLTYEKAPAVDLTQRIKPYIAASGIDVENAEVPPGTHTLRLNVTDTDGHTTSVVFSFSVSQ
jgi:methionine-rich copper-binding protein CopC